MRKTKRKIDKVTIISIVLIALFYMSQILLWDGERSDSDSFQIICFTVGFLYGNFYIIKKIINSIRVHEKYTKSKFIIDSKENLFLYMVKKIHKSKNAVIYADPKLISELNDRFGDSIEIRTEQENILECFNDSDEFDCIFLYPSDKLRLIYFVIAQDTQSILNTKKTSLLKEGEKIKKDPEYYSDAIDCFYKNVWIVIRDIFYV
jgi:hypothetical protein